jgi:putative DNA primase/helicase
MTIDAFLDRLERVTKSGAGHMACCPAHEDRTASLSIRDGDDGKILLFCQAGCETKCVLEKLNLTFADISGHRNGASPAKQPPKIVATYDYTDEAGTTLYQVVRYEPKDFRARRPDGKGAWIENMDGVRRVLYNLPAVLAASHALVCEGEKDADRAVALGLVATCNVFGAGAGKWTDEYSEALRGKDITIVPDNDAPGRKHAEQVARSLVGKAKSIAVCWLPEGVKDLSEWPLSAASLIDLIHRAPAWSPDGPRLGSCSTAELFRAQEKEVSWMCWPFSAVGLATIIDALPKVGKTVLTLQGILASRERRPFLSYPTKPMRVLYVSEQSRASLAMQAREIGFTGLEPIEELRWITREDWSRYIYTDFLAALEKEIIASGLYDALVIDTFHTVARMEDEKDASEVNRLGNLTIDVATRNAMALTMGRHDRKSGGDIGVSGRSSIQLSGLVDVILHLVRVPGQTTSRKLELLGRVPGLPNEQTIDLANGVYINYGDPVAPVIDRVAQVTGWIDEQSELTGEAIVAKFAALKPSVKISLATANRYKARYKAEAKSKKGACAGT